MSPHVRKIVIWGPRILGLMVTAFMAMFALDAFDGLDIFSGQPIIDNLPGFAMHLIPAAIVGFVVAVGWRRPWLGAIGFGLLALAYAVMVPQRPDWILAISGPLAVLAVLFALSTERRPSAD